MESRGNRGRNSTGDTADGPPFRTRALHHLSEVVGAARPCWPIVQQVVNTRAKLRQQARARCLEKEAKEHYKYHIFTPNLVWNFLSPKLSQYTFIFFFSYSSYSISHQRGVSGEPPPAKYLAIHVAGLPRSAASTGLCSSIFLTHKSMLRHLAPCVGRAQI